MTIGELKKLVENVPDNTLMAISIGVNLFPIDEKCSGLGNVELSDENKYPLFVITSTKLLD